MRKTNVLIFPAGEINSVELHDSLSNNVNIRVFGASSVDRHGKYIFENYRSNIPNISEENFLEKFNDLIREWKIDYIFPTHDTVALFFAKNQVRLEAKAIVCEYNTALICRDKKRTYDLFRDEMFCPQIFEEVNKYPVFIKPREGQGAKGTKFVEQEADMPTEMQDDKYVVMEYLPGEELTVDCLTDAKGHLCAVLPRSRERLLAGVCTAGRTRDLTPEIFQIADVINDKLDFFGLWYFQIKKDINGKYKLLEISARCPGTMCLSRARGINLPLLSVYVAMGRDITIFNNPYTVQVDRALVSRYLIDYEYQHVFIDYDDTIVGENGVIVSVVSFLYQCRKKGKHIHLLTRHNLYHEDCVNDNMKKNAICADLFDEIIELTEEQNKFDYVTSKDAIFIDNSYEERKMVHEKRGIPVFDVEGIEILFDWRN